MCVCVGQVLNGKPAHVIESQFPPFSIEQCDLCCPMQATWALRSLSVCDVAVSFSHLGLSASV